MSGPLEPDGKQPATSSIRIAARIAVIVISVAPLRRS
jgi:hypothetical protein